MRFRTRVMNWIDRLSDVEAAVSVGIVMILGSVALYVAFLVAFQ